jgi:hypothetical protein
VSSQHGLQRWRGSCYWRRWRGRGRPLTTRRCHWISGVSHGLGVGALECSGAEEVAAPFCLSNPFSVLGPRVGTVSVTVVNLPPKCRISISVVGAGVLEKRRQILEEVVWRGCRVTGVFTATYLGCALDAAQCASLHCVAA